MWRKRPIDFNRCVRSVALVLLDMLLVILSMGGALWMRCDFKFTSIDSAFLESIYRYMLINVFCTIVIFALLRLYSSLWRFASIVELRYVVAAVFLSALQQYAGMKLLGLSTPRSYPFIYFLVLLILVVISRFSYRFTRLVIHDYEKRSTQKPICTMVIGAGAAGHMIVREMKSSKHINRRIPCIIDDDAKKVGTYLHGIPIVGRQEDIPQAVQQYDIEEIVIAIPTLTSARRRELLEVCQTTSCKILALPGIYQLVNGEVSVSMLREINIEDLLGREPVTLEMEEIMNYVSGKVLLVTGGGGSIGSELCRQLALHRPKQLLLLDIYENNAYELQNELKRSYPDLNLVVLIGSVRNQKRVDAIFETYHPQLVFHAAAHKHVPLMEDSPNEAIKNNVQGTWVVAHAADRYRAERMVLISTDKAVRPTSVMGASKRICEQIVRSFAQTSKTVYASVRFGNVLGSNGSVIPLFKEQIAAGGPVTVTHPEIIRYFMTIPEAVNLVLQCGALARDGEIFILDMGEPVKILDLARKMIRLTGLTPGEDIKIEFTGLRPGEKLFEELLINEANLRKTVNERIFIVEQPPVDTQQLSLDLRQLIDAAYDETGDIRQLLHQMVPEYRCSKENPQDRTAAFTAAKTF